MLGQVLRDNGIQYVTIPVNGAGLSLKTGLQDRLKIYVPADKKLQATSLLMNCSLMIRNFPYLEKSKVREKKNFKHDIQMTC